MSAFDAVRRSASLKIALKLSLLIVVLLALASTVTIVQQTRQMEEQTLEKARATASLAARQYGEKFDEAIDNGNLTVADVFDRAYAPIKGWDWGEFPKFHTRYDSFTDRTMLVFQDKILADPDFEFAVGVDENGYLPTHNTKFQQPLQGKEQDQLGNRTKRMFNNKVELAAAKNLEPTLVQSLVRDTGEQMWDVSAPVFVKGKHWGAFRIGVSKERIVARQGVLTLTLAGLLGTFALVTIFAMYVLVRSALKPVVALTETSVQISLGEALDQSVKSDAVDEFGQLANAIERLRVSMKAAMARLGGLS